MEDATPSPQEKVSAKRARSSSETVEGVHLTTALSLSRPSAMEVLAMGALHGRMKSAEIAHEVMWTMDEEDVHRTGFVSTTKELRRLETLLAHMWTHHGLAIPYTLRTNTSSYLYVKYDNHKSLEQVAEDIAFEYFLLYHCDVFVSKYTVMYNDEFCVVQQKAETAFDWYKDQYHVLLNEKVAKNALRSLGGVDCVKPRRWPWLPPERWTCFTHYAFPEEFRHQVRSCITTLYRATTFFASLDSSTRYELVENIVNSMWQRRVCEHGVRGQSVSSWERSVSDVAEWQASWTERRNV
jgi:hypothetical protein